MKVLYFIEKYITGMVKVIILIAATPVILPMLTFNEGGDLVERFTDWVFNND